ncbi:MAG TPA: hypothetical protein VGU71_04180 [Candidatus Dormibacteraeota bacterium]|nr:hypothetical protein [Candidatus Dormibacteraeota bacterium]
MTEENRRITISTSDPEMAERLAASKHLWAAYDRYENCDAKLMAALAMTPRELHGAIGDALHALQTSLIEVAQAAGDVTSGVMFVEGYKAGLAEKADAIATPPVSIAFGPGAIQIALPDAVRVQLEKSPTESRVTRDASGQIVGIRTA